jgi:CRISPR-associated endonuclease Csy4
MKHYLDITLIPSQEVPINIIWSKVYLQFHLAIVEAKKNNENSEIAAYFPNYIFSAKLASIGNKLRVFSKFSIDIDCENFKKHFSRLSDYIHISCVKDVPANINEHAIVSRFRVLAGKKSLEKRREKRNHLQYKPIVAKENEMARYNPPWIVLKSLSGKQSFSLFVSQKMAHNEVIDNRDSYGLSASATVPVW